MVQTLFNNLHIFISNLTEQMKIYIYMLQADTSEQYVIVASRFCLKQIPFCVYYHNILMHNALFML